MTAHNDHASGRGSQGDEAYATIRESILHCVLAPGELVSELHLATRFGFGRAAVRTALTRLDHERLVEVMPRRGYRVAPVTFKHVQDLYGVRLVVEPAAARLAAEGADTPLVAELERWNLACRLSPDQSDLIALREANKGFHATVGRASGNDRLADLSAALMDELDRVLYLPQLAPLWERLETTYEEHQRIIEALRARNPLAAEQAAHEHVMANRRDAIEALIASPGLRSINLLTV
jgi:DNA-binding GntR family transcriptional regulator